MKSVALSVFVLLGLWSCKNKESISDSSQKCYLLVQGKDSIRLNYSDTPDGINGSMQISGTSKPASTGSIQGTVAGDTLKLIYSFKSTEESGKHEVILLKKDQDLIMAAGNMSQVNGITLFDDPQHLDFNAGLTMKSVTCP